MRTANLSFLFFIIPSLSFADLIYLPNPPINFGGGLELKTLCSEIADNGMCDGSNMISTIFGAREKRNGSKRYLSQAISSNPINTSIRIYTASNTAVNKALIVTSKDSIYYSSGDASPYWIQLASGLTPNQHFESAMINNRLIMTGEALTDPIKQFNLNTASFTNLFAQDGGTNTIQPRAKYLLSTRNYLIAANCIDVSSQSNLVLGSTVLPSRLFYSLLAQPSSFTASRFIDIRTEDGEGITGLGENNRMVHIFKETSISELDFTVLNLTANGGDPILRQIVQGFGLYAPRTLANIGDGYILGAKDGIRFWDGGRKSRLQVEQESRNLSIPIQPIIDRLIKAGTYRNAIGKYYPKKSWYILSYEDPAKYPKGRPNQILVYDLRINAWFKFDNWNVSSFESLDGIGDKGELLYGDSVDGYVYYADLETSKNDARRELVIDTMDSTWSWVRSNQELVNVKEGTASLRMTLNTEIMFASMTRMALINLGSWNDASKTTTDDLISFKVLFSSLGNVRYLQIGLQVDDVKGDFNAFATSVTFSSAAFVNAVSSWTTITVAISSFPLQESWSALGTEDAPFSNTGTYYGVRFISSGTGGANIYIDDLRLVGKNQTPLNAYCYSKQFNFGTPAQKRFRKVILNRESSSDGSFYVDVFNNFGAFLRRDVISGNFTKDLFVAGYKGNEGVARISSVDLSFKESTDTAITLPLAFALRSLTVDPDFIYAGDVYNQRLVKIDKSSMTVFVSSFGAPGSGTDGFNNIFQMAQDKDNLYICDFQNNRIKVHSKKDLSFVNSFGELGTGATNFHVPSGIGVDAANAFVFDDGNNRIVKLSISTFGFVSESKINLTTIGNGRVAVDDLYLYDFYTTLNDQNSDFLSLYLEKRNKSDLAIVQKEIILNQAGVSLSSYVPMGDIALNDDYVYIPFTDDENGAGTYYIQKRLKSDLSLVDEYSSTLAHYGLCANGYSYLPKRTSNQEDLGVEGDYLQVKYSENGLDNNFKLFNQAFLVIPEPIKELKP